MIDAAAELIQHAVFLGILVFAGTVVVVYAGLLLEEYRRQEGERG